MTRLIALPTGEWIDASLVTAIRCSCGVVFRVTVYYGGECVAMLVKDEAEQRKVAAEIAASVNGARTQASEQFKSAKR